MTIYLDCLYATASVPTIRENRDLSGRVLVSASMSGSHCVPAETLEREIEIKKSRFIARAGFVCSREEAMAFLERTRHDYADARHHCWAYLIGDPATAASAAMNDDGEPSGTAGKPILNVIQHKGLGDVMVVVTRYFGGVKLGAGGLVRAYSGATEAVLSALRVTQQEARSEGVLQLDFSQEQPLRHWAGEHDAELAAVDYGDRVSVRLVVRDKDLEALDQFCRAHGIERHD